MSLFSDYLKERHDKRVIENDKGFVTFKIVDDKCYLEDMFVLKECRNKKINGVYPAVELVDSVFEEAKAKGCKWVFTSVVPSLPNGTENIQSILRYGFRLSSSTDNFILFEKEV